MKHFELSEKFSRPRAGGGRIPGRPGWRAAGLALIVFFLAGASALSAESRALVLAVKAPADAIVAGKKVAIKKDMLLKPGTQIQTGKGGSVMMQLSGSLVCRVGEKSKVSLDQLMAQQGGSQFKVNVQQGSFGAKTGKEKVSMNVQTPTAIASVRGTEFIVESEDQPGEANDESTVLVNEGEVAVTSESGDEAEVEAGNKVEATPEGMKESIMEAFEKRKFEIFEGFDKAKKQNYEAYVEQIRKNQELRDSMRNR